MYLLLNPNMLVVLSKDILTNWAVKLAPTKSLSSQLSVLANTDGTVAVNGSFLYMVRTDHGKS